MSRRAALLALVLAGLAEAVPAEPLGRLFFTPERRAAMERQRQMNVQETQTVEGAVMSLNGIVTRSSGQNTVWINRRPQPEHSPATGVSARIRRDGKAVITVGEEAPSELRVGESLNQATRELDNGIGGGSVAVKPDR